MDDINIFNADCILGAQQHLPDECVDLMVCDPPFGIGESSFDKHYKRDSSHVIEGYQEAPQDYNGYLDWTIAWLREAKRVLKANGSLYVIMGHSNLRALLNAAAEVGFHEINHIVWKYTFGVYTQKKYVTSHYHVLYYSKSSNAQPTFNTNCRYGSQEVAYQGGKRLYQDLEDVFVIPRENKPGEGKNQNKLPDDLLQKVIQYSSNPGDVVCDFFLGNFTTAYVSRRLGRKVCGFEVNPNSYNLHEPKVQETPLGCDLGLLPTIVNEIPLRQGEPVTDEELGNITARFQALQEAKQSRSQISKVLQFEFQRGPFAIKNILDRLKGREPPPDPTDTLTLFDF